jgi:hypothetical protein
MQKPTNKQYLFVSFIIVAFFFGPPTVMGSSVHQHYKLGFCYVDGELL